MSAAKRDLALSDLPLLVHDQNGQSVLAGLMVDYWVRGGDHLLVSGWRIGEALVNDHSSTASITYFRRADVEKAHKTDGVLVQGFLAVIHHPQKQTFRLFGVQIADPEGEHAQADLDHLCADHRARLGFVVRALPRDAPLCAAVLRRLPVANSDQAFAHAFIEQAKAVPRDGGLVVGWTVALPDMELALVDGDGRSTYLNSAVRWHRPDIVAGYGDTFGTYAAEAGFVQGWHHPVSIGEVLHIVAIGPEAAFVLATAQWGLAPNEPVSYARWAFSLPTPPSRFIERIERHDGPLIAAMVRTKLAHRGASPFAITDFGERCEHPLCSVIVPLYGRYDFMFNQLLAFSEDPAFEQLVDLIYVVDDPKIVDDVLREAPILYEANRIPFRVLSYGENRGYAGANNAGVAASRAERILLLNSDVIPVESKWLTRMVAVLDSNDQIGIVGARMLYQNGAIQHEGMTFQWEPTWQAFINQHPRIGFEPRKSGSKISTVVAVTGACMLLRTDTYREVGGLDEGFLIGDFEDSDLCLKVSQRGMKIVLLNDIDLVHLERQSLVGVGGGPFRELITRYNAWRHGQRWKTVIERLVAETAEASGHA